MASRQQPMLHEKVEELLFQKIRARFGEIGAKRYWAVKPIQNITMRQTTDYEKYDDAVNADGWQEIKVGDEWGGNGEFAWFKLSFTVPDEYAGKPLVAIMKLGLSGWLGGEGCLFIDGVPFQGIDRYHPEVILTKCAKPGDKYDLVVECVSTEVWRYKTGKVKFEQADIAVINQDAWDYWFDLGLLIKIAEVQKPDSRRRATIVREVNKSVDLFDMDAKSFDELSATAIAAREIIKPLYDLPAEASALEVACAGHSHIDVAWLWPYAETIRKCSRTFSTVDRLMEEYPEYKFTQSQAQVYEFTKDHYPALYEKIKKRVAERRFEPQGSMWVEADCNICSGESLVRQILLGKGYFMDEFGIDTNCFWLPDVFGYSAALPQIIKKAGIDYFMTIKISWSQFNRFPYSSFWWEGIDGTKALAHFPPADNYNARNEPDEIWKSANDYIEKDRSDIVLHSYGWGDGGGGPDRMHLENLRRAANVDGLPQCTPMWTADFYEQLEKRSEDLPTWVGELYLEYHRGTYTTQAKNKLYNRKSEFLMHDTEMIAALAWLMSGAEYPSEMITKAWKLICKNQFHDVIPGSSVTEVYVDSTADYMAIFGMGDCMRNTALKAITGKKSDGMNVALFNTLSWRRNDSFRINVVEDASKLHAVSADGIALPSQPVVDDLSSLWITPDPVAGIGIDSIRLAEGVYKVVVPEISISTDCLENRFYSIKLDQNGLISSIFDKRAGREVVPEGARSNQFQLFEDKPIHSDAWDIEFYYPDKRTDITQLDEIVVEESGPVRGSVKMRRSFGSSVIEQRIVLWNNNPRIDFETKIDWHEHKKLLKVAFPVDVHTNSARFEIQFGSVDRPTHSNTSWDFARFEVAAQKWADLSQADFGVSLLNDCKYGHDVHENVLHLTLLRAPTDPDPYADRGEHTLTYSLLPHQGDWRCAETVRRAYELNVPMVASISDTEAPSRSFITVDAPNVVVETVKKAEKEDAMIVRMYECSGINAKFDMQVNLPVTKASECDLMERDIEPLNMQCGVIALTLKPFEIKTIKLGA
ncbi:MAG: alpha-mannosidase [Armatimonadota bacterium]